MEKDFKDTLRRQAQEKMDGIESNTRSLTEEQMNNTIHELHVHQLELEMQNDELNRSQDELRRSQQKFMDLYHNAPCGFCTLTENGVSLMANRTLAEMLGVTLEDIVGQTIYKFLNESETDKLYLFLGRIKKGSLGETCEIGMKGKDNSFFWAELENKVSIDQIAGCDPVIELMIRDVTDRKQLKAMEIEKIQREKELAEKTTTAKSLFLANVSHEIRSPLNGIIGMLYLLNKSALDLKQNKYITTALSCSNALLVQLNDLIDLSAIEANKLRIENKIFQIHELLNDMIDDYRIIASNKMLQLRLELEPEIPVYLRGDPARVIQILRILLDNAVKFTTTGEIVLQVNLIGTQQDNLTRIAFALRDTGCGIAEDKLGLIFEKFTQADETIAVKYGGSGLGLVIVEQLVKMMQGKIDVTSKVGEGSTFRFILDFKNVTAEENEILIPGVAGKNDLDFIKELKQQPRILVVEDEFINQLYLKELLKELGIEVELASDGRKALEFIKSNTYTLVFMDLNMPDLNGIATTRMIRDPLSVYYNPHLPIIGLSGYLLSDDNDNCLKAGMNDYLMKPFTEQQLYHILARWLRKSSAHYI